MASPEAIGGKGLSQAGIMGADNADNIVLWVKQGSLDDGNDGGKCGCVCHGSLGM